jgi:hypothetical protein
VFAEILGIRPWETDLLTVREFDALARYIDDKNQPQ